MFEHILLFIVALISNIFSAFSGGGAGVIQLPAILHIFDIKFISALAIHKIATVALGIGATMKFIQNTQLNNKFIFLCIIIGIPFVIIGVQLVIFIDDVLARNLLGVMIILISSYAFFIKDFGERDNRRPTRGRLLIGYFLICLVSILNGSLSAGTGLIFTSILIVFFGMMIKDAIIYTLLIVGFFYNLTGAIAVGIVSEINWLVLPSLFIGSLLGGYFGAKLSIERDNGTIKNIYQLVTFIVGVSLIT